MYSDYCVLHFPRAGLCTSFADILGHSYKDAMKTVTTVVLVVVFTVRVAGTLIGLSCSLRVCQGQRQHLWGANFCAYLM